MIGTFVDGVLDEATEYLEYINDGKAVCVCNYTEDGNIVPDEQLKIINAYPKVRFVNPNYYIFNVVVMRREYFKSLGGYDCIFEATALSHCDLAIRAQNDGANVRVINKPMLRCSWTPRYYR